MQNPFDQGYYASNELRDMGFKSIGDDVLVSRNNTMIGLHNISIGDGSRIDGNCSLIATGPLDIGRRVHIHSYCQIGSRGGVTFEDYSAIASGCLVYSASDDLSGRYMIGGAVPVHFTRPKIAPVHFERYSGAFSRCTILPGVTMHEGSVACAHSLVSRSVKGWTIVAGNPASHRIARSRRLLSLEAIAQDIAA